MKTTTYNYHGINVESTDMTELVNRIKADNAQGQKWVEDGKLMGNVRHYFEMVDDAQHWADSSIFNIEDYEDMLDWESHRQSIKEAMTEYFSDLSQENI